MLLNASRKCVNKVCHFGMWSKRRTAWRLILDIMRCVLIWLLSCFALGCTLASHVIAIRHVVAALEMFRGHRTCSVATGRDHANAKCKSGLNVIAANFISDFNHLESSMTMRLSFWPVEVPLCVTWKSCAPPGAKACFIFYSDHRSWRALLQSVHRTFIDWQIVLKGCSDNA